jgi:hypothetical protein
MSTVQKQPFRRFIEVDYQLNVGWVHPLLSSLNSHPKLRSKHKSWSSSKLSDFAFAVETRHGTLPEIVKRIDGELNSLISELETKGNVIEYIADWSNGKYAMLKPAFHFKNQRALKTVLYGVNAFIVESRACFENLTSFYREFVKHYFDKQVSKPSAYAYVAAITGDSAWANDLKAIRDDLLHERSTWLAFEVLGELVQRYEAVFTLNWRPGSYNPGDSMTFSTLRGIQKGLDDATFKLTETLKREVEAFS